MHTVIRHRSLASKSSLAISGMCRQQDGSTMKALFWIGLVCVVLGLLSFLTSIPYTQRQTFQAGGIGIGVSQTEQRHLPVAVGAILIIGGLSMMVGGCRNKI